MVCLSVLQKQQLRETLAGLGVAPGGSQGGLRQTLLSGEGLQVGALTGVTDQVKELYNLGLRASRAAPPDVRAMVGGRADGGLGAVPGESAAVWGDIARTLQLDADQRARLLYVRFVTGRF